MNKLKLILAMSIVCLSVSLKAHAAPQWSVPEADSIQPLQSADYGGVYYATSSFSSALSTVVVYGSVNSTASAPGRYIVYGVNFSSSLCSNVDWADVYDSTDARLLTAQGSAGSWQPTIRFYNIGGSTATAGVAAAGTYCAGEVSLRRPVRFNKGLQWKVGSAGFQGVTLFYWKEENK